MTTAIAPGAVLREKFFSEKEMVGGVSFLTLGGTLNNDFIGKKVADYVKTKKAVISLRNVRRFASWGMSEWMDFLRIHADSDLYLVECSTYALSQINLVTGLLGHAKLVSYYASYRCTGCTVELEQLFIVPRDREVIRDLQATHQSCPNCGSHARLEEYPAAFFETIANRQAFDIDDEVLAFLNTRYKYELSPDFARFRAHRRLHKNYTYMRLSGSLALMPAAPVAAACEGTTVVDLEDVIFDPDQMRNWRTYLDAAQAKVPAVHLLNCPPQFLDTGVAVEDLRNKVKVRTLALPYECIQCEKTSFHMIDVANNLEELVQGTAPAQPCPSCRTPLVAALSYAQQVRLRDLPARDRDPVLDAFLAKARRERSDKLENALALKPELPPKQGLITGHWALMLALVTFLAAAGVLTFVLWPRDEPVQPQPGAGGIVAPPPGPKFERPDWIISDIPSSAYCHDLINRIMCVGISAYRPTRDEAVAEAGEAALDELAHTVALKITEPVFKERVLPRYSKIRSDELAKLQPADVATNNTTADAARKVRKRVVEILRATAGPSLPTQRTDWHWEEYVREDGKGRETLVFIRYDLSLDAVRSLADMYSPSTISGDMQAMTAFAGLAWQFPDFDGGALVTKPGKLAESGVAAEQIVVAVGGQKVKDVPELKRALDAAAKAGKDAKLTVKGVDGKDKVVDAHR